MWRTAARWFGLSWDMESGLPGVWAKVVDRPRILNEAHARGYIDFAQFVLCVCNIRKNAFFRLNREASGTADLVWRAGFAGGVTDHTMDTPDRQMATGQAMTAIRVSGSALSMG